MKHLLKKSIIAMIFCVLCLTTATVSASAKTTYYSMKQVGLKDLNNYNHVVSVKGNTLTYQKITIKPYKYDFKLVHGKKKTAKLTSSTKYYLGDIHKFNASSSTMNKRKWIRRVNKATFIKAIDKYSWWDQLIIKNGKVQKAFLKMQVAS